MPSTEVTLSPKTAEYLQSSAAALDGDIDKTTCLKEQALLVLHNICFPYKQEVFKSYFSKIYHWDQKTRDFIVKILKKDIKKVAVADTKKSITVADLRFFKWITGESWEKAETGSIFSNFFTGETLKKYEPAKLGISLESGILDICYISYSKDNPIILVDAIENPKKYSQQFKELGVDLTNDIKSIAKKPQSIAEETYYSSLINRIFSAAYLLRATENTAYYAAIASITFVVGYLFFDVTQGYVALSMMAAIALVISFMSHVAANILKDHDLHDKSKSNPFKYPIENLLYYTCSIFAFFTPNSIERQRFVAGAILTPLLLLGAAIGISFILAATGVATDATTWIEFLKNLNGFALTVFEGLSKLESQFTFVGFTLVGLVTSTLSVQFLSIFSKRQHVNENSTIEDAEPYSNNPVSFTISSPTSKQVLRHNEIHNSYSHLLPSKKSNSGK